RKRPERFAVFDVFVEVFRYVRRPGRSQQAAIAERPWAEFRRSLIPGYDLARTERLEQRFEFVILAVVIAIVDFAIVEDVFDFLIGETRSPIHVLDRLQPPPTLHFVMQIPGGSKGCTFVTRRGLDKEALKTSARLQFGNDDGIEKESAGQT